MEWVMPTVLALLFVWGAWIRTRLSRLRNAASAAWPPLEAQLRRRHGLVTPLAQALAGLRVQKAVQALLKARNAAALADLSPMAAGLAEKALEAAIATALAQAEAHPEQTDAQRLAPLVTALTRTGAEIATSAQAFNQAVHAYNHACRGVPAILIAQYLNFRKFETFGPDDAAQEDVALAGPARTAPEPMR